MIQYHPGSVLPTIVEFGLAVKLLGGVSASVFVFLFLDRSQDPDHGRATLKKHNLTSLGLGPAP